MYIDFAMTYRSMYIDVIRCYNYTVGGPVHKLLGQAFILCTKRTVSNVTGIIETFVQILLNVCFTHISNKKNNECPLQKIQVIKIVYDKMCSRDSISHPKGTTPEGFLNWYSSLQHVKYALVNNVISHKCSFALNRPHIINVSERTTRNWARNSANKIHAEHYDSPTPSLPMGS